MTSLPEDLASLYAAQGYFAPLQALTETEANALCAQVDALRSDWPSDLPWGVIGQLHFHLGWARWLAMRPAILEAVAAVIGPEIEIQACTIFDKAAGDGRVVDWHQDGYNLRPDKGEVVTAWIALTHSTPESGCLKVLPGSHRGELPHACHVEQPGRMLASGLAMTAPPGEDAAVSISLRPGQMSLHHIWLAHASAGNRSSQRRLGFVARYQSARTRSAAQWHPTMPVTGPSLTRSVSLPEEGWADHQGLIRAHRARMEDIRAGNTLRDVRAHSTDENFDPTLTS